MAADLVFPPAHRAQDEKTQFIETDFPYTLTRRLLMYDVISRRGVAKKRRAWGRPANVT
jgi:hypothetical protein